MKLSTTTLKLGFLLLLSSIFVLCTMLSSCGTTRYQTTHKQHSHYPAKTISICSIDPS